MKIKVNYHRGDGMLLFDLDKINIISDDETIYVFTGKNEVEAFLKEDVENIKIDEL